MTLASLSLPKRTQAEKVQQEGCLTFTAAFSVQRRASGEEQTLDPTRQSASRKIKKRRLYDVSYGMVLPHLQKFGNWALTSTLRRCVLQTMGVRLEIESDKLWWTKPEAQPEE